MDFETARDLAFEYFECLPGVYVHELRLVLEWAQTTQTRTGPLPPNCTSISITLESVPGIDGWLASYHVGLNKLFLMEDISID